jgi:hypothetical protein
LTFKISKNIITLSIYIFHWIIIQPLDLII